MCECVCVSVCECVCEYVCVCECVCVRVCEVPKYQAVYRCFALRCAYLIPFWQVCKSSVEEHERDAASGALSQQTYGRESLMHGSKAVH